MMKMDGRMTVEEYLAWYFSPANDDLDLRVELVAGAICEEPHVPIVHADAAMDVFHHLREVEEHVYMGGSVQFDEHSMWNPIVMVLNRPLRGDDEGYLQASDLKLAVDVCDDSAMVQLSIKVAIAGYVAVPEYWVINPTKERLWRFRYPEPQSVGMAYSEAEQHRWPDYLETEHGR